jgi:hypothetical protein
LDTEGFKGTDPRKDNEIRPKCSPFPRTLVLKLG